MLILLWACVSETSFQDRYAEAMCDRYAECFDDTYTATYGDDAEACATTWNERGGETACLAACEFDASAASSCLYAITTDPCDDVFSTGVDECFGVYDCSTPEYRDCLLGE